MLYWIIALAVFYIIGLIRICQLGYHVYKSLSRVYQKDPGDNWMKFKKRELLLVGFFTLFGIWLHGYRTFTEKGRQAIADSWLETYKGSMTPERMAELKHCMKLYVYPSLRMLDPL